MAENLRDLINKMKQENSQTTSANTNPRTPQKAKEPEEEIDEEFDESVDLEEEKEETPKPVKKLIKRDVPQETEEVSLAEQIRNLHDNGIFRLELLGVLHQINNNLRVIAGVLVDYKK